MCAIYGAIVWSQINSETNEKTNELLHAIFDNSFMRGRDGWGHCVINHDDGLIGTKHIGKYNPMSYPPGPVIKRGLGSCVVLGNHRAEPTTEYVKEKKSTDQQPYKLGRWAIVHNGTIANDKELRSSIAHKYDSHIDSAAIVELLNDYSENGLSSDESFNQAISNLKGSFAIIASNGETNQLYVACNYRPIWRLETKHGVFFGSTRNTFGIHQNPEMVPPYSAIKYFYEDTVLRSTLIKSLIPFVNNARRALVVCSGGLDSVVSAIYAQKEMKMEVELMHFHYGSRAGGPELTAIKAVAEHMGVPLRIKMLPMWDAEDSPLLQANSKLAGGEQGAEFAHEWVPARNLVMLAVATAYAEAKGFNYIVLGNNLEEAGAYPDNEPEFIDKFNDMLPFAVGDGKRVQVLMPVGNMMKHEIVKLGHNIGAPMHLTWSCYRAGQYHCGKCGPCFMRRTAFEINELEEVIKYEE